MKLNITVDGRMYEVEVEVAQPEHPIYGVGGKVSTITVKVGDSVRGGQILVEFE